MVRSTIRGFFNCYLHKARSIFEPGTDYEYSNSDYVLLGILIERVAGIALGEYVRREIFIPFEMNSSWFQPGGATANKPAQGYMFRDGSLRPAPIPPQTTGDGGMYGSVSDLLRWLQGLERPRHSYRKAIHRLESPARLGSGEVLPHASGLFWNRYKGRRTLSHNGSVEGFQADVVHFPNDELSVVCLCNRGDVNAASISRQIADVYLGMSGPQTNGTEERPSRRTLSTDLSGKWESRQGFILSTKVDGSHLIASLGGEGHAMSLDSSQKEFAAVSSNFRLLLRRRPNWFTRIRVTAPNSPKLSQYAGRFVNDELHIEWNLLVSDGSLLITTLAGWRIPLVEAAPDRLEAGPWFLEFERTEGNISGLALHRERLWKLKFQRIDENRE